jgi:hypothetical protein
MRQQADAATGDQAKRVRVTVGNAIEPRPNASQ